MLLLGDIKIDLDDVSNVNFKSIDASLSREVWISSVGIIKVVSWRCPQFFKKGFRSVGEIVVDPILHWDSVLFVIFLFYIIFISK